MVPSPTPHRPTPRPTPHPPPHPPTRSEYNGFSTIGGSMMSLTNLGIGLGLNEYWNVCNLGHEVTSVFCTIFYLAYMATSVLLLLNLLTGGSVLLGALGDVGGGGGGGLGAAPASRRRPPGPFRPSLQHRPPPKPRPLRLPLQP
jgi:hypothetical protein